MKEYVKKMILKNKIMYFLVIGSNILRYSAISKIDGSTRKYPKVIQLPITSRCNSHCVMCNIWQMDYKNEVTVEEFAQFMQDPIFKEVEHVGINGGEPSLIQNLPEFAKEILKLPKLKSLNIISNGFNRTLLLESLEAIYKHCRTKGVNFHIAISLDGVGIIHNKVRGTSDAFEKTTSTIDEIIKHQYKYCDSYDIGCTIVNHNIEYIMELDAYTKNKNYKIKYRLGIDNKRLNNEVLKNQYSVIYGPSRQSAKEFFHYLASQTRFSQDRFKYYSIFYWLNSNQPRRLLGCIWKDEGITVDGKGELYYCAVSSKSIGSLRSKNGEAIFFADKNIKYRKQIIKECCDECIHDYTGKPQLNNLILFYKEMLMQSYSMELYRIKSWLL